MNESFKSARLPSSSTKTILVMDNSAHMIRGGGQLFVGQIVEMIRKYKIGRTRLLNSEVIGNDFINLLICNKFDSISRLLSLNFPRMAIMRYISRILEEAAYFIRIRRISSSIPKKSLYDLVLSNDITDLIILVKRRIRAKKVIVVMHNPYLRRIIERNYSSLAEKLLDPMHYLGIVASSHKTTFISLNPEQTSILKSHFRNSIVEIPNGIDTDKYSPLEETNKDGYILFVGRLDENQKRISLLLDLIEKLDFKNKKLVILGEGNARPVYEKYAFERSLSEFVQFTGRVDENDKINYYRKASLFVSASVNEALSYTFLEAMSCGLPLVSYRNDASDLLIRDGFSGYIVENQNEFVQKVNSLLNNQNRLMEFGKNARQEVVRNYSQKSMFSKYQEVFSHLINTM